MKSTIFGAALLAALAVSPAAQAMSFSSHGYYRLRVVGADNLDLQGSNSNLVYDNNRFGFIQYNQMRLRIEPTLKLNDWLSLHSTFDILDNVLFGTESTRELNIIAPVVGEQTLPPGAGSFYMAGPDRVGENGAINVRRVWMDVLTPIGKIRAGRQPSNWGLGIFQNDGNGLQGDFGDTADRIMYLMQYGFSGGGAITAGVLWDIAYEAQFDPRITGLASAPESNNRDAQQYAALVMYDQPEFSVGLFGGLRRRNGQDGATTMFVKDALGNEVAAGIDGDTMLYFADLYARYTWRNYTFKLEGVYLGGDVTTGLALDAIPFTGLGAGDGIIQLPPKQSMSAFMAAFEATGNYSFGGEWKFQAGYAPGDPNPLSTKITEFGFRPDYNIALMMFYMPLGTTPSLYGQKAGGTGGTEYLAGGKSVTANYVNNAFYFTAGYKHKFEFKDTPWANWAKIGGKFVTAWAPKKNTNINFADLIPQAGNWPALTETSTSMWQRWYGLEMDISAEAQLFNFLYTALDIGFLLPGRAYSIDVELIDPGNIVEPIPYDKANMAWMVRLSTVLQF
ncbi:MAG: hypothetical protein JXA24_06055 [Proteobacteria bacterium]|nr:hypothetical protein [Pseudomonadota bacterium]